MHYEVQTMPIANSPVLKKKPQSQPPTQIVDEDNDKDDLLNDYGLVTGPVTIGRAGGKSMRSRSPMVIHL